MVLFFLVSLSAYMFFVTWNLLWGLLVIKIYNPKVPVYLYWLGALILAGLSFLLPPETSLLFWFPGGAFVSIVASIAFLTVLPPQKFQFSSEVAKKTFTHKELHVLMSLAENIEDKRSIYVGQVKNIAAMWAQKSRDLARENFILFSLLLVGVWLIDYASLLYFSDTFLQLWQASNQQVATLLQQPLEEVEKVSHLPLRYSAAIVFIFNALSIMLISAVVQKMAYRKEKVLLRVPSYVSLFKIPEPWVFVFLFFAVAFIFTRYFPMPAQFGLVVENVLVILAFFYVLNGIAIINTYLQVRLFPTLWLITGITFLSILAQEFFVSILFFSFFIGVADFWFNFRNKALYPALVDEK